MANHAAAIGDMLLLVGGSSWIVAMFLLGAFAFLSYKRGFTTLMTILTIYPVAAGVIVGGWLPTKALIGFALLGMGALWAMAVIKLLGTTVGEGNDIQKIVMVIICWNMALAASDIGFGQTFTQVAMPAVGGNWVTGLLNTLIGIISTIYNLVLGGSIVTFVAASGLEGTYVTAVQGILLTACLLAFYPLLIKFGLFISQVGIKGWLVLAAAAVGTGTLAFLGGFFG